MFRKIVNWSRHNLDQTFLLWVDALLTRKLFVVGIPYNLNYFKSASKVRALRQNQASLNVVDVGSRGAPPPELLPLRTISSYTGFDASYNAQFHDPGHTSRWANYKVKQSFIGRRNESIEFYHYSDGGLSSALKFNPSYGFEFTDAYSVDSTEVIPTSSLSESLDYDIADVDFLKLDTQGTELDILRSEGVSSIPLVEIEVEFIEVYSGQPLFGDVFNHMVSNGYRLLWLTRHFGSPRGVNSLGRGSLVFGEALFGFSTTRALELEPSRFENYLLLLASYGHPDFAEYLLKQRDDLGALDRAKLCQLVSLYSASSRSRDSAMRQPLRTFFEKVQFLAGLPKMRHNGFQTDSDRAIFFR